MSNIFCVDFLDCRENDSTNNMTSYGTLTVDENKINNIKQILLSINNSSDTRNIDKLDSLITKVLNTRNSDNMLFKLMNVLITKHRDARNGDGNKIFGKKLFAYILNENLSFYERAMWMSMIVLVGSFKDFYEICEMEQTTEESIYEISRFYLSVMMNNLRTDYCYLPEYIVSYVEGKSGLAFKWCPINKGGNLYDSLVKHYATTIPRRNGNGYMYLKNTSSSNSAANFVKKQLRKFVSSNKGRCDLLEVQMSKKGGLALLDKKNPKKVCDIINKATSGAHRLHRGKTKKGNKPNLWERCPNGYKLWLKGLEKGDPNMKRNTGGGTTSIFELMWDPLVKFSEMILNIYYYSQQNVTFDFVTPDIEQAFSQVREQMRDYLEDCNNIMLMLDMSGSMGSDNALALAIGFTMLFSMRNKEDPMDGVFIAFSQNPRIVKIQHNGTVKGWMRSLFNEVKKDSSICGLSTNFFKAFDAMRDLCIRYSLPLSDILVVTDMRVTDRGLFGNDGKTWVEKVTRMSEEHNKIYCPKRPECRGTGCFVLNCQNGNEKPCSEDCDGIAYSNISKTNEGFPGTTNALRSIREFCLSRYGRKVTPFSVMMDSLATYVDELEKEIGGPIPIFEKMRVCSLKDKLISFLLSMKRRNTISSVSLSNVKGIVRYICNLSASWIDFD